MVNGGATTQVVDKTKTVMKSFSPACSFWRKARVSEHIYIYIAVGLEESPVFK